MVSAFFVHSPGDAVSRANNNNHFQKKKKKIFVHKKIIISEDSEKSVSQYHD